MKKVLLLVIFFYILALLQTSFLVHFNILRLINFILISVILINLFTAAPNFSVGVSSAFIGGFFLDIFSGSLIGINVLILLSLSIFIKVILKKYVRSPAS